MISILVHYRCVGFFTYSFCKCLLTFLVVKWDWQMLKFHSKGWPFFSLWGFEFVLYMQFCMQFSLPFYTGRRHFYLVAVKSLCPPLIPYLFYPWRALGGSLFEYSTRRPSYITALALTKFNLMCVNLYVKQCTLLTPLPRTAAKNACEIACEGKIWNLRAEKWSAFGRGIIPFANSTLVNLIWQPKMPRGPPLTFAKMCTDQKKNQIDDESRLLAHLKKSMK